MNSRVVPIIETVSVFSTFGDMKISWKTLSPLGKRMGTFSVSYPMYEMFKVQERVEILRIENEPSFWEISPIINSGINTFANGMGSPVSLSRARPETAKRKGVIGLNTVN
jgi:hypothetical protein